MALRQHVHLWADPWKEGGAIIRKVWLGGSTDDGYWPDDRQLTPEEAEREVAFYAHDSRVTFTDCRPAMFPFKRLGG